MLTEKQISNIIYYGSAVLAMIPLTVLYALTGVDIWAYALLSLVGSLFGLKLALNDIPHWVVELKNIQPSEPAEPAQTTEEKNPFEWLEKKIVQIDEQLKDKVEEDQGVVPSVVIEERELNEADLSFLGSLGASTKKE